MAKNKILLGLAIFFAALFSLSLVSAAYYPYHYNSYDDCGRYDSYDCYDSYDSYNRHDSRDRYGYGYNPYYQDNYVETKVYAYADLYGYEHGPQYVGDMWGFASIKSTGFTQDGGYQTTRAWVSTNVDYPNYGSPYGYGYPYYGSPRNQYYYDYAPRQQYYYYY